MKVVLFCGGQGMRLREASESLPKPMVPIGSRPVLWHLMKYYAHYGHKDFILCLGHRAHLIKEYFLNYNECVSNNFVLRKGGKDIRLLSSDIDDWNITFVDTGLNTNIGGRLKAVEPFLADDEMFLANYADGLTDFQLPLMIDHFRSSDAYAAFLSVKPTYSFHVVNLNNDDTVQRVADFRETDVWINGGYFIFRREIFDHLNVGEELIDQPFQRLISKGKLISKRYKGFWVSMDTFKDKQRLEELHASGNALWEIWQTENESTSVA